MFCGFPPRQDSHSRDITVFLREGINVLSKVDKDNPSDDATPKVDEQLPTSKHSLTFLSNFMIVSVWASCTILLSEVNKTLQLSSLVNWLTDNNSWDKLGIKRQIFKWIEREISTVSVWATLIYSPLAVWIWVQLASLKEIISDESYVMVPVVPQLKIQEHWGCLHVRLKPREDVGLGFIRHGRLWVGF